MRKISLFGVMCLLALFVVSLAGCKKEEVNNNGNNNGNTENPGGGSSDGNYNNQEYPSTANVIRRAVTDIDGNIYDAVQIGNQVWMAENLRTTKYADGTTIPLGTDSSTITAYRYAPGPNQSNEENMVNVPRYGYLYNWPAVMHGASSSEANPSGVQGICPNGWHVPSEDESYQLLIYLASHGFGTGELIIYVAKALASTWGWNSTNEPNVPGNNPSTNNASGFSALPSGRHYNKYINFGDSFSFCTTTEQPIEPRAVGHGIQYNEASFGTKEFHKYNGCSVRCVRD